ncbi:MAG: hypothetical protein AAF492_31545, partial [Verrucomicrobiota bacterium]
MSKLKQLTLPKLFDRFVIRHRVPRRRALLRFKERCLAEALAERRLERAMADTPESRLTIPEEDGMVLFEPGRFSEVGDILQRAGQIVEKENLHGIDTFERAEKPQLWDRLLQPEDLQLDSPFLRLALREDLVRGMAGYLG